MAAHRPLDRLTSLAREMRREPTQAEKLLWRKLRGHRFSGLKWRRQQAFGPFILDFCCAEQRLAIELDGDLHVGKERYDADRQAWIENQGVRVLRFTNGQVKRNLPWVLDSIEQACDPSGSSVSGL